MSEVKDAAYVGNAIRKQLGSIPKGKIKKKKPEEKPGGGLPHSSEDSVKGDRPKRKTIFEGEEVPRNPAGSLPGPAQEIIDAELITKPRQLRGGKKALPKPAPKAIEAPGTGPYVGTPLVDLNPGPNFGGTVYEITKAKKPRQFEGY